MAHSYTADILIKPFAVVEGERRRGREGEGREGGKRERRGNGVIVMVHSYTADLRFSPMLTEVYSDTKKVFSRNPRMMTAPIQNCQWKEREEKRERGGGGRRGRGREGRGGGGEGEETENE